MGFVSLIARGMSRGAAQIFGSNESSIGGVNEPGSGEYSGGLGWTPVDLLLKNVRFNVQTAADPGKSWFIHYKKVDNIALGSSLQIANPATEASADLEVTAVAGTANYLSEWNDGTSTPTTATICTEYEYVTDPKMSFYQAGSDFGGFTIGGSNVFLPFNGFSSSTGTEADVKTPWPLPGTFKRIVIAAKGNGTTVVTVALRKNGADTGLVISGITLTGSFTLTTDLTTTVTVAEGDLLDWRITRTSGSGTTADLVIGIGHVGS